MHLIIACRGNKDDQDEFIRDLVGKFWPFRYINPETKKMENYNIRTIVQPMELYSVVFPEAHKDIALATILGDNYETNHKQDRKLFYWIRKLLRLEKIPKYETKLKLPIHKEHVEVVGIGIRKDEWEDPKTKERIKNPTQEEIEKRDLFECL